MSLRRFFGVCATLVVLAGVVLCRTYWVGRQTAYAASAGGQTVQTLALPRARGDFFDRNGRRLTGTTPRDYALGMSAMKTRACSMSAATLPRRFWWRLTET